MLVAVERDLREHAAFHGPRPAAEIMEAQVRDASDQRVEGIAPPGFEHGAGVGRAAPYR